MREHKQSQICEKGTIGIPESKWRSFLDEMKSGEISGITMKIIGSYNDYCNIYITEVLDELKTHFHYKNVEKYEVVEGEGLLNYGPVQIKDDKEIIEYYPPIKMKQGYVITMPSSFAHRVKKISKNRLFVLLVCPEATLTTDRKVID